MKQKSTFTKERIVKTDGILGGRPRIKGYRIGVEHIMMYITGGATIGEVLRHYPDLSREDILACIDYSKHEKDRKKKTKRKVA